MQTRFSFCSSLLLLSSTALAQSFVTSPNGFVATEGHGNAAAGAYADGRYMYIDEDMMGQSMTIKGIAFRHDNLIYTASQGMGRSWTNVTLDMSICDANNLSTTFSNNPTSTPTRVLSIPVTWPTQTGKPSKFPADFTLNMPFQTVWAYGGAAAICADFVFHGGVLANSGAWSTSTYRDYEVDGVTPSNYTYVESTEMGESGNLFGCNDRNLNSLYGARVTSELYFYSRTYSNKNYAGNLVFKQTGNWFGPNAPVITAIGIRTQRGGWDFPGVTCNRVYLDPAYLVGLATQTASANGDLPALSFGGTYGVPAPPGISGVDIVTQAIWRDTKNLSPLLSSAAVLTVPETPLESRHQLIYHWDNTSATGFGPSTNDANVVFRYER